MAGALSRVALVTQGSRGDFQPVLALAGGLGKAGYATKIFTAPNHCGAAREFGVEAVEISPDVREFLDTTRGLRAMEKGAFSLLMTPERFDDDPADADPEMERDWLTIFADAMEEFRPDLIVYLAMAAWHVKHFVETRSRVPTVLCHLQPHMIPSETYEPVGMTIHDPEMPNLFRHALLAQADAQLRYYGMQESGVESILDGPHAVFEAYFCIENAESPIICPFSKAWWPAPDDWPKANVEIVGCWKIPKAEQEERSKSGQFFNAGGAVEACEKFLQSGPAPVYIGWGSMRVFTHHHMACLAVRALKEAGQRGIIVGGWSDLSADSLEGAEDAAALRAYCEESVLFMKAAPHEWLFPQCACCVHHGGIGTAQASLSAGTPTVVTPVFGDQMSIARKVQREKCGVGTAHLSKVTAAELGAAIRACCTDATIQAAVKKLGQEMQKEDGVAGTIEALERFWTGGVRTGEWKKRQDENEARLREKTEKMQKIGFERIVGMWDFTLAGMFPVLKDYAKMRMEQGVRTQEALQAGKLWVVRASGGCLARRGESIKSPEAGRFGELCLLEELVQKGPRLHARRLAGAGPDEGWVSPLVSGKALAERLSAQREVDKVTRQILARVSQVPRGHPPKFLAAFGLLPPRPARR